MQSNYVRSEEYYEYLVGFVGKSLGPFSMERLLRHLYSTEFKYLDEFDKNRFDDGIHMRYRFIFDMERSGEHYDKKTPANMLEVMVGLAVKIEAIMAETMFGDRTHSWFWSMCSSLGLNGQYDEFFDADYVDDILARFNRKEYDPDGHGGLFWIRNYEGDMRELEIWTQADRWLSNIQ